MILESLSLNIMITALFFVTYGLTLILAYLDYRKKRTLKECHSISFIVPTYNDSATIKYTVESIFSCCPCKFELFVVNDCSKDNTLDILKELKKKYDFTLVNNKKNLGKSKSVNNIFKKTKGEIIFIVDSDIIVNEKALKDVLARFDDSPKVGAVGGKYKSLKRGFWEFMQDLEYNMGTLIQAAHNPTSTISLCGGFMAVRKEAFERVGMLSENMLTEDIDLAFKLNEAGYIVEQSFNHVYSLVPNKVNAWVKQKIRWSSGGIQCYIKHFGVWIKNPLIILFFSSYSIIVLLSIFSLLNGYQFMEEVYSSFKVVGDDGFFVILKYMNLLYGAVFIKTLLFKLSFSLTAIPYFIMMGPRVKDYYKLLGIIPFSLIYFPALGIVSIIGFFIGVYKYFKLKENDRSW